MSVYFRRREAQSRPDSKMKSGVAYRASRWELIRTGSAGHNDKTIVTGKLHVSPDWARVADLCSPEEVEQARAKWIDLVERTAEEQLRRDVRQLPASLQLKVAQIREVPADELADDAPEIHRALDAMLVALAKRGHPYSASSTKPSVENARASATNEVTEAQSVKKTKKAVVLTRPSGAPTSTKSAQAKRSNFANVVALGTQAAGE